MADKSEEIRHESATDGRSNQMADARLTRCIREAKLETNASHEIKVCCHEEICFQIKILH